MGFASSFRQGRAAAQAMQQTRARSPRGVPPPSRPLPQEAPSDVDPTPIKLGYYYDNGQTGASLEFYGERHLLLLGLNGAGKSTRLLVEFLMTAHNRSIVVLDLKGELYYQTAEERRRYSDVKITNAYNVLGLPSDGFAPLHGLEPSDPFFYEKATEIAEALIEIEEGAGQYWSESAQGLVIALIMWVAITAQEKGEKPKLCDVRTLLTERDRYESYADDAGRQQERLVAGLSLTAERMIESGNPIIASLIGRFVRENGRDEIEGIQSTADTQTKWMLSPSMQKDEKKNGIDFSQLRHKPTTVYVVLPPGRLNSRRAWVRLLFSTALNEHLVPGEYGTVFIIDEFRAAVGNLKIINDMWALVRGFGVQIWAIVQSALQLQAMFKDEWENFAAQSGATITLGPPGDLFTAKWMSERSGTTTVTQMTMNINEGVNAGDGINGGASINVGARTGSSGVNTNSGQGLNHGKSKGASINVQRIERPFLKPHELMDMLPGMGRIWLPGMGTQSIPFYAPNYWQRSAEWVQRVKPNPYSRKPRP